MQTRIESIVRSLGSNADKAHILAQCCSELSRIAGKDESCRETFFSLAGIEAVLAAMSEHVYEGDVQLAGCSVLEQLLTNSVDKTLSFVSSGGVRTVVNTMAAHRASWTIQVSCCRILYTTAACNLECAIQLVDAGAVHAVIEAMSAHTMVLVVQDVGCSVLQKVITPTSVVNECLRCGFACVVLRAMQDHSASSSIQKVGCKLLSIMVSCSASLKAEIIANRGVETVVKTMLLHPENGYIQRFGCLIFLRLLVNGSVIRTITECGGIQALLGAMANHREEQRIQTVGCRLLKDLAEQVSASNDQCILSACVLAALRAMEKHPNLRKVQDASSNALKVLTSIDSRLVTGMCLGRCGRLGGSVTSRALDAIKLCDDPAKKKHARLSCRKRSRLKQLSGASRCRLSVDA